MVSYWERRREERQDLQNEIKEKKKKVEMCKRMGYRELQAQTEEELIKLNELMLYK